MHTPLPLLLLLGLATGTVTARNLHPDGSFDHPEAPLSGWHTDYAWTGNRHYADNASRVSVVPQESGRRNVLRLHPNPDGGTKAETLLFPFEEGMRYRAQLNIKGDHYRVYFAGYQWAPGIRPHRVPALSELRQVYRSKPASGSAATWQSLTLDMPGTEASPLSLQHLRRVRFVSLYLWIERGGYVDDVVITRTGGADPH